MAKAESFVSKTIMLKDKLDTESVIKELPVGILICTIDDDGVAQVALQNKYAQNLMRMDNIIYPVALNELSTNDNHTVLIDAIKATFDLKIPKTIEWSTKVNIVTHHLASQIVPMFDNNGQVNQVICTIENKTTEKLAEKNLLHHAFHDTLTSLPNRIMFKSKLESAVADSEGSISTIDRPNNIFAILIVNVDRFKNINDTFGLSLGDRLLVEVAETLKRCIGEDDFLARISGDEFAVIVPHCDGLEEIETRAALIHQSMTMPVKIDDKEIITTVSIGISSAVNSGPHPEDLIKDANHAMNRAKATGKSVTRIFDHDVIKRPRSQFHIETELRRAVSNDELELYYQPIIDMETNKLKGFEGLSRWNHKDRGMVPPVEFIPIAEETGVIVELGRWAMNTACRQLQKWNSISPTPLSMNVNVSGYQFARDNIEDLIFSTINETNIQPEQLTVELTESAIIDNPRHISFILQQIRDKGVKVALDDFGTGYSSLNYLHQFPIDCIKIDRSFIVQLVRDSQKYEILKLIAKFGKNMGLTLVAEGMEDIEHVQMLKELNIDFFQGFYYSKPLTAEDATKLITANKTW